MFEFLIPLLPHSFHPHSPIKIDRSIPFPVRSFVFWRANPYRSTTVYLPTAYRYDFTTTYVGWTFDLGIPTLHYLPHVLRYLVTGLRFPHAYTPATSPATFPFWFDFVRSPTDWFRYVLNFVDLVPGRSLPLLILSLPYRSFVPSPQVRFQLIDPHSISLFPVRWLFINSFDVFVIRFVFIRLSVF